VNWSKWILQIALLASTTATAERMDIDTHAILITKLEGALKDLPNASEERPAVMLRLADLRADRARLQALTKQEKNCAACPDGKADRLRAIELYSSVAPQLDESARGPVYLQLAYLQTLSGQSKEAAAILNKALQIRGNSSEVTAKAHAALGEIEFRNAQFKSAEQHFRQALQASDLPNPGFVTYRLSWSLYNQGKFPEANKTLVHLLETPEYLTVRNQNGVVFDKSFHDDLTRDLVLFIARGPVGKKEIDLVLSLTPEALRRENLKALALELERLGNKNSSALAWAAYSVEGDNTKSDTLETTLRLAQLKWDLGQKKEALEAFANATAIWRKQGCSDSTCADLEKRMKNFVTGWHKIEKSNPSRELLKAYDLLLITLPSSAEVAYQAATVAEISRDHAAASRLYALASRLGVEQRGSGKGNSELIENSLMKQIESAEKSGIKSAQIDAYDNYLQLNKKGSKALLVRYQRAQVTQSMGQTESALTQFLQIATEKASDQRPLRLKAADLALDALALLKDDRRIFDWSEKLAARFPERKVEYLKIHRLAAIKLAANSLNHAGVSSIHLREELARLKSVDFAQTSTADKITLLRNRIAIAERVQDLEEVQNAALSALSFKDLQPSDREFFLGRLAWVAEVRLDFANALKWTQKMNNSQLTPEDRALRLAMLSELAGEDPTAHYKKALKLTKSPEKSIAIRASLVRLSENPWSEISRHLSVLKNSKGLLTELLEASFARDPREQDLRRLAKAAGLEKIALIRTLDKQKFIKSWREQNSALNRAILFVQSDRMLQKSIEQRRQLIHNMEVLGQTALKLGDWSAQLLVVSSLADANKRFYDDLMALPAPKRLSAGDRSRYLALVRSQAEPIRRQALAADAKRSAFWDNTKALKDIESAIQSSQGRIQSLLKEEARVLATVAPRSERRRLENAAETKDSNPSSKEWTAAKERLRGNPFSASELAEFKRLSQARGQATLVSFLDNRLAQIKSGGSQ
jgi:hypothetical protein